jgi:hypothetical protein
LPALADDEVDDDADVLAGGASLLVVFLAAARLGSNFFLSSSILAREVVDESEAVAEEDVAAFMLRMEMVTSLFLSSSVRERDEERPAGLPAASAGTNAMMGSSPLFLFPLDSAGETENCLASSSTIERLLPSPPLSLSLSPSPSFSCF